MAELKATPRNALLGLLADAAQGTSNFVSQPFGYANPPGEMLMQALGVPALAKTLDTASYGGGLTRGTGYARQMLPDTAEALLSVLPGGAGAKSAAPVVKQAAKVAAKELSPQAEKLLMDFMRNQGLVKDIFIGEGAKTWDSNAANQFKKMSKQNFPASDSYAKTGTFDIGNGRMAQEISDAGVKTLFDIPQPQRLKEIAGEWITYDDFLRKFPNTPEAQQIRVRNTMMQGKINDDTPTLDQVLSAPDIFSAYPDLASMKVAIDNKMPIGDAAFSPKFNSIVLSPMQGKQAKDALLHEVTHAIQQREGFPIGGNPLNIPQVLENISTRQIKEANKMIQDSRAGDVLGPQFVAKPGLNKRGFEKLKEARDLQTLAGITDMSPDAAFNAYERLHGEAMARMVPRRSEMSLNELRQNYPMQESPIGLDVPMNRLIYRSLLD